MIDVSIIIVNYKTLKLVQNCISSIKKMTKDISYEIIVVDNDSNDGIEEILPRLFPETIVLKNSANIGFGRANNAGALISKGKYLFFLNADTLLLNNCLKKFFNFMEDEKNKKVAVCGGILYNEDLTLGGSFGCFPSYWTIFFVLFGLHHIFKKYFNNNININSIFRGDTIKHVDYVIGADMFMRRIDFINAGMFDKNIFLFFEETDLCYRFHLSGNISCIIPSAKIVHLVSKSFNSPVIKQIYFHESQFYYFRKQGKSFVGLNLLRLVLIVSSLLRYLLTMKKIYLIEIKALFNVNFKNILKYTTIP